MALLHARAGQPDIALDLLRLSLRIDLDDLGGTTAAGVHIGACGGAWQAVVAGFLGARVSKGRLLLDPRLPECWPDLEVRFRCLGRDVLVRVDADQMTVDATAPLSVQLGPGCRYQTSTSTEVRFDPGGPL
jgi:trehalose/maltose hydrolase-like predicted phosphorylase